jgi:hypothetical protein
LSYCFHAAAPAYIFTEVDACLIEKGTPAQLLVQMLTWPVSMKGLLETRSLASRKGMSTVFQETPDYLYNVSHLKTQYRDMLDAPTNQMNRGRTWPSFQ